MTATIRGALGSAMLPLLLLPLLTHHARSQEASPSTIHEEALDAFVREMDARYPFFDLKGIRQDWESWKAGLRQDGRRIATDADLSFALEQARLCLRDAHMSYSGLKAQAPQPPERYYPGIAFLPAVDGQVVVMSADPEYGDDFAPGTIVTHIDGVGARQFLDEWAENDWLSGGQFSSPQRARLYAYRIPLQGDDGQTWALTVEREGQAYSGMTTSKTKVSGWPHTYAMPEGLAGYGDCHYGRLKTGIGYIYLQRIGGDLPDALDHALSRIRGAMGLIVDLRGNGGGGYSWDIFSRFDDWAERKPGTPGFYGDIVVLIDAGTISAGETFARDLVYSADAWLMGEWTAGSSTAKRQFDLPHGLGSVIYSYRSRGGFNGQPIEYNGIAPYDVVEVVPAELSAGLNSGIRRAEEYLGMKARERLASDDAITSLAVRADIRRSSVAGASGGAARGAVVYRDFLPANLCWKIPVKAKQRFRIEATATAAGEQTGWSRDNGRQWCGPAGIAGYMTRRSVANLKAPIGALIGTFSPTDCGASIVRDEARELFRDNTLLIGEKYEASPSSDGYLYLACNDTWTWFDNYGALDVTVTIEERTEVPAESSR